MDLKQCMISELIHTYTVHRNTHAHMRTHFHFFNLNLYSTEYKETKESKHRQACQHGSCVIGHEKN